MIFFLKTGDFSVAWGGFQFVVLLELFLEREVDLIFNFEHLTIQFVMGFWVSGGKGVAVGGKGGRNRS